MWADSRKAVGTVPKKVRKMITFQATMALGSTKAQIVHQSERQYQQIVGHQPAGRKIS